MKSKIRIVSDRLLLVSSIILSIVMTAGCIWFIWVIAQEGVAAEESEIIPMQVTFAVLLLIFYIAILLAISENICLLTLSDDSVSLRRLFHKDVSIPYKRFINIYHGRYFHGNIVGMGMWVHFIVFSQNYISPENLSHINQLRNSEVAFKIRLTKRNYNKLCSILPSNCRRKMDASLANAGLI